MFFKNSGHCLSSASLCCCGMRLFRCLRYSIDCKLSFNINQTRNKADGQMLSGTDPFPRHSDQSVVSVSKLQMNYRQPAGQRLWLFRINQPLTSILSLPFIPLLNWQRAIFGIVRFNVIMKIGMWRFGGAIFRGGRVAPRLASLRLLILSPFNFRERLHAHTNNTKRVPNEC